jgi:soluble lytic murein transglycosylase
MSRYVLMLLLFIGTFAVPSRSAEPAAAAAEASVPPLVAPGGQEGEQGPMWRASRILGEYLTVRSVPVAGSVLATGEGQGDRCRWTAATRLADAYAWPVRGGEAGSAWDPVPRTRESPERAISDLRRGLALAGAGQARAAVAIFDQVAAEHPWLADWASFYAAESLAPTGDTAEVRRRLEVAGPSLTRARGWRFQVQAARSAHDLPQARRLALEAAGQAASPAARAAAWTLLGSLRLEAGDTAAAREAYRSAMQGAPAAIAAVDAARSLTRLGPTPEDWRRIASVYLRHGNHARAIAGFESYLASGAGSMDEAARVRVQLGDALLEAGRHADAERHLLRVADEPVPPRIAADALFLAGRAQQRRGRTDQARETWQRLAIRFPDQPGTARALLVLAQLQHDELDLVAARASYLRAASAAPHLAESGLALMRLGGLQYIDGEASDAASSFEAYRRMHPTGRHRAQADYWTARSYLATGRRADAEAVLRDLREREPLSYYGIRAAELLGEPALAIPLQAPPPRRERTDSLVQAAMLRVDVLDALGRRADLAHEVDGLRSHFAREDGGDYALAEALNERGHSLTALSVGWDIFRREGGWNTRLLRIIYPFPFQTLVAAEARDQGVDPYLVAAVIRRESAFNPGARSSAGAIGLMQIMPATGRGLARELGMRSYNPEMLRQPDLNVHLGVRYLGSLLRQFDDELHLVLSAYNAGPSRAIRWRQLPERREPELFVERIPFAETREYVRHVKIHLALYRELYPGLDGLHAALAD